MTRPGTQPSCASGLRFVPLRECGAGIDPIVLGEAGDNVIRLSENPEVSFARQMKKASAGDATAHERVLAWHEPHRSQRPPAPRSEIEAEAALPDLRYVRRTPDATPPMDVP